MNDVAHILSQIEGGDSQAAEKLRSPRHTCIMTYRAVHLFAPFTSDHSSRFCEGFEAIRRRKPLWDALCEGDAGFGESNEI